MKEDSKRLGENLKEIRMSKNITQSELAEKLGADKSFVSNIENGKTNPTLSTITSLAKALGVGRYPKIKTPFLSYPMIPHTAL
jgi:transcriptional regulator with XRE-family HTH domain